MKEKWILISPEIKPRADMMRFICVIFILFLYELAFENWFSLLNE